MERVPKIVLNAVALAASVSISMAAAAPISSDYQASASATQPEPARKKPVRSVKVSEVGQASWYGEDFDGKPTASGEPFDMYELTAAHRTLPLGTWVKVTNIKNRRWVLVRINDRGPVPTDRIIDLSYGAARMLNMSAQGLARVRLDIVNPPAETSEVEIAMLTPIR